MYAAWAVVYSSELTGKYKLKLPTDSGFLDVCEFAARRSQRLGPWILGFALLISVVLLGATSLASGELARAFWLGAYACAVLVSMLLAVAVRATAELRRAHERFAQALDISNDGFWEWNLGTGEMRFSKRWCDVLGYAAAEVEHSAAFREQLIHSDDAQRVREQMLSFLSGTTELHECEYRLRAKSGDYQWKVAGAKVMARNARGEPLLVLGVDVDVTRLHKLSEQISYQVSHDILTGLVNRREFERRLRVLLGRSHLQPSEHALLVMDLDQFAVINESCGHAAGDDLLCQVARTLKRCLRQRDTLARLGGDEFGILLEHCSLSDAQRTAKLIIEILGRFQFTWQKQTFRVSGSLGLAPLANQADSVEGVLKGRRCCVPDRQRAGR